jgi:endonuclease/exonuclease/phosphatase family metal-dependent hydrolase
MDDRAVGVSHAASQPHPFDPIVLNRAPRPVGTAIKVVALNACGGRRVERIIGCLKCTPLAGADVIMLCEADWRHRRSAWREFAAEVAAALDMSFAFLPQFGAPTRDGKPTALKGLAILCSQPLRDVSAIPIPNRFLHPRLSRLIGRPAGLAACADFDGKVIGVGVVHLNSRWDPAGREWQMSEYLKRLPLGIPAIVGGDLNTTTVSLHKPSAYLRAAFRFLIEPRRLSDPRKWETLFVRLHQAGFRVEGANAPGKRTFTFTRAIPPFMRPHLDWIAVRDLEPVAGSARVVRANPSIFRNRVSDHDFVMCEVTI